MDCKELLVAREGRIGRIRLNRPNALNSLTLNMVRDFTRALAEFVREPDVVAILVTGEGERGFCAGGDIRKLYELRDGDKSYYRDFWREEYQLNAMIAACSKPYVVIMDGLVMGGGVGLSAHGNCRIVTERTRLAMPETSIGFVPDVGGTWLLAQAAGAGVYMGLSGATVSAADAIHAGFADHFVYSHQLGELIRQVAGAHTAQDVAAVLQYFSRRLEPGELAQNRATLRKLAKSKNVEEALAALLGDGSDFARSAAKAIARNSPTSLKATYALLQRARDARSLEQCLTNEYRAACGLLESHDLYEGIRAAIVDKDPAPKWRPATLEEVDEASVRKILAGDGSSEPLFPFA
ncbi:enoyl-CoA hydratase/isomerase family protein [Methylocystis parvus OBBP]|uniref:3-hydroxyisobutyryl-CoA hydrolase n=1 Tax=Methylocystis parvus TaxID=134 RepID=A0A6B8MA58_9HYPH|nr:enoyl-CoA hydratase/isomerase family protein [Methylocystis parvus]QGM99651.1 enoyl-CoA hydratase/isomerase family protein [Methylocystis parvus]WBK02065.1 enoyl-CoA hydratase/isomerase family protein [Methylocystis parvus OBBP]